MMRAVDCAGCRWWREGLAGDMLREAVPPEAIFRTISDVSADGTLTTWYFACMRGHRPRFYRPRSPMGDFGWRRRCGDYHAR